MITQCVLLMLLFTEAIVLYWINNRKFVIETQRVWSIMAIALVMFVTGVAILVYNWRCM